MIKTGNRARKSSAGYDLTRLIVGSEGTLGIITELTLRLQGMPEAMSAAIASFPDVGTACEATIMAMQSGIPMARIELLDAQCVEAINGYSKTDFPVSPLLLLEFHGSLASVAEQAEMFGEIAKDCGGTGFEWVAKPEERTRLVEGSPRRLLGVAVGPPGKAVAFHRCLRADIAAGRMRQRNRARRCRGRVVRPGAGACWRR